MNEETEDVAEQRATVMKGIAVELQLGSLQKACH